MKFLLKQRLQLSSRCRRVAMWQVGLKQLFMLSGGGRFDSVMIQSNCGE